MVRRELLQDFPMFKKIGLHAIPHNLTIRRARKISRRFWERGIRVWISHGTLLGFYRDGNIIEHDTDFDFSVSIEDLNPNVFQAIEESGFVIDQVLGDSNRPLQIKFSRRGSRFDLYVFYKNPITSECKHSLFFRSDSVSAERIDYFFPSEVLEIRPIENGKFSGLYCPSNPELFLSAAYGKDWKHPTSDWSIWFSPPNGLLTGERESFASWVQLDRKR